jgi:hypothetical protein
MKNIWFGPIDFTLGKFSSIPGPWIIEKEGRKMILKVPSHFYGEHPIGSVLHPGRYLPEDSLIDFVPKYFSFKILGFLLSRGACHHGAFCWAELPPEILNWHVNYRAFQRERYPHENKFFDSLSKRWPKLFIRQGVNGIPLVPRPPLELLKRSALSWGL